MFTISFFEKTNTADFRPVIVNEDVLKAMDPTHVFVCKWPQPLRWKWYKIILAEEPIIKCDFCNKVNHFGNIFAAELLNKLSLFLVFPY